MSDGPKHFFVVDDAISYGILEAILLENIRFWISNNKANGKNFCQGRTWTYNSVSAYQTQFPYASAKQIRRALDKLVEVGVLEKGHYALYHWDRRTWYSFADEETQVLSIAELQERAGVRPKKKKKANSDVRSVQNRGELPPPPATRS